MDEQQFSKEEPVPGTTSSRPEIVREKIHKTTTSTTSDKQQCSRCGWGPH